MKRTVGFGQFALAKCLAASLLIWHESIYVCNISTQINLRQRHNIYFRQQLASTTSDNIVAYLNYHIYLNQGHTAGWEYTKALC